MFLGIGLGLISGALGAVGSLFKTGLGIAQMIRGGRMKPVRPTYNRPEEIDQMLALRQATLNGRGAGAVRAEQNIAQSAAAGLNNMKQGAGSSASLMANAALGQANTNRQLNNLAAQEEMQYQQRLGGLEAAQQNMAQFKDKEFQINEMQPYQDAVATKSALMQGGLTNTYNGLTSAGNMAGKAWYLQQQNPNYFNGGLMGLMDPNAKARQMQLMRMQQNWNQ